MKQNYYFLVPFTPLETHPTIWLSMTLACVICACIQILIGVNHTIVKSQFLLEIAFLYVCTQRKTESFSRLLAGMLLLFFLSGGTEYSYQIFFPQQPISKPVSSEVVYSAPEYIIPNEADAVSIYDYFSRDVIREIRHAERKLPLGSEKNHMIFAESNQFFCRIFTLKSASIVDIYVTKADQCYVPFEDVIDWDIALVYEDFVLYSGTVNRIDEVRHFSYNLAKGDYTLIIMRCADNSGVRRINIASSFEPK